MTTLYKGDCLVEMAKIPDKSVDMILCDLPYGVLNRQNKDAQWDNIIPLQPMWEHYLRVIKDNGAIVLFCQGMFTAELMMSQPKLWRYNLIWDKVAPTGFLNANVAPLRSHEDIAIFYKSRPAYHPQMIFTGWHKRNHGKGSMKGNTTNQCYGDFKDLPTKMSEEKFPTSIITISKEHSVGKFFHPTQKPVNLCRYLIRTYTNEGDTVLDNTMGSGTTGVACVKEKRNFIGIELNEEYFKIAKQRIENEESQPTLF